MPEEIKINNNSEGGKAGPTGRRVKFLKLALIFSAIILIGVAASLAAPHFFASKQPAQIGGPKPDEITITKLPDGNQLVENKTESVSFQLSSTSFADKTNNQFYSSTPDNSKCKISSAVSMINSSNKTIQDIENSTDKNLVDLGLTIKLKTYQIIQVSGRDALKESLLTNETGYSVSVNIPAKDNLYSFILYSNPEDKFTCDNYFNNFLKSVLING